MPRSHDGSEPSAQMFTSLAALYGAGATLGVLSLLLPRPAGADEAVVAILVAAAALTAALVYSVRGRLPVWVARAAMVLAVLLINTAVYFSGTSSSPYAVMLIWVVVYGSYFFSRVEAAGLMVLVAACYGATIALHPDRQDAAISFWLLTTIGFAVVATLVAYLVQSRRTADAARAHLAALVRNAGDAIYGISPDGVIQNWNRGAQRLYGWHPAEIVGQSASVLIPEDIPDGLDQMLARLHGERVEEFETTRRRKDGTTLDVSLMITPVRDGSGKLVGGSLVARDITSRKELERQRQQLLERSLAMARSDPLTGLANRRAWDDELRRELAQAQRRQWPLCVAMIDLDRFKEFNDDQGHPAGDELLRESAATWRVVLRASDVLARYGGDEFALLLPDCGIGDATNVVSRLRSSTPLAQTCSAGIAMWDGSESPAELISRADEALYDAKREGRDRLAFA